MSGKVEVPRPVEPCPHCGVMHTVGNYIARPELRKEGQTGTPWNAPDVQCPCGALLRATVPICKVNASGYVWKRIDPPAKA